MRNGRTLACLMIAGLLATALLAQDKKADQKPGNAGLKRAEAGQMSDAEQVAKMMAEYMKLAAPGKHHEYLKSMAGQWIAKGKYRMTPGGPWAESKSQAKAEFIMGGRFLMQKVKGEPMMGMPLPFEGLGIFGYDNHKQKYNSVWMDNMGTMMMYTEGSCDDDGKTFTFKAEYTDPISGADTWMKSVYRIQSNDKFTIDMYSPTPDGGEFLAMTVENQRVE